MNLPIRWISAIATSALVLVGRASAQQARSYTPDEVYSILYDAIRKPLQIPLEDPRHPYWLGISLVGTVVDPADQAQVNDLANFCPIAKPVITSYVREPKLDAIYERLLTAMVGPVREYSEDYHKAQALLNKDGGPSPEFTKYREYEDRYAAGYTAFISATDAQSRSAGQRAMNRAAQDWVTFGFRGKIDQSLNIIFSEESRAGNTRMKRRRETLDAYQKVAIAGTDLEGAFKSPASTFSPAPSEWEKPDGWLQVSYSTESSHHEETVETRRTKGFGGLSLGFVTIGGSGGSGGSTSANVNRVYKLGYDFEIKRVSIRRPWLDTEVFFEPAAWTWKKQPNTKEYPHVAIRREEGGLPRESEVSTYDNKRVAFALLPVEAVIARGMKIRSTVSKSDYAKIESSGSAGGGGSLFGLFGGAKKTWSVTKESEDTETVTFVVESKGISVVGLISQVLPALPEPNPADKWPDNAWLPFGE